MIMKQKDYDFNVFLGVSQQNPSLMIDKVQGTETE